MEKDPRKRAADLLHLRGQGLSKGDPVALPLVSSSMFHLPGDPDAAASYGRVDNPTWQALEHSLAVLEDAPCVAFPSGMAAISAALFATLTAGQTLLIPSDGYYVTRLLSTRFLSQLGVRVIQRPTLGFAEGGFDGIDVVFIESPSNPGLDLCDIAAIAAMVRAEGGITIVDNTTMTPFGQRPLALGADLVVSSDTKAPGGHSDVLMGHVATRDAALLEAVLDWRKISGAIPSAQAAWLLHRGLETLEVRFDRMCQSAQTIAQTLEGHKAVQAIRYPGLASDPAHDLAKRQMLRFGFLIGLTLADKDQAEAFITASRYLRPATSFGGVHSSAERRIRWGDDVAEGFVRLSVGCEPVDPLLDDLLSSLDNLA
ncbi:cystathionine gamma-lyase [Aliiroseovarius zhejiangensis]|uniref:Cystathionine gamma-lyase n=1 Tax=Aliiroseovarius zhejiangensis TaxID=1632025 RepID=A0ABQ3IUY2_9RHOB|nr:cystathionine gamma-lyase [Aliiroseovarius zhejiangensis]GHE95345.1 cystathionine gamma-lyase [Aliiroseovarius zhejiangensis]